MKIEQGEHFSEESSQPLTDDPLDYSSGDDFNEQDFELIDEKTIENVKLSTEQCSNTPKTENSHITDNSVGQISVFEDEFDYFSKYLSNKLRKYDNRTSSIVQHEISNIIFKADMGEYVEK